MGNILPTGFVSFAGGGFAASGFVSFAGDGFAASGFVSSASSTETKSNTHMLRSDTIANKECGVEAYL